MLENNNNIITLNPNIKKEQRAESTRQRSRKKSSLLSPELREAAKQLRNNKDIIIRKADKSNIYVILNRTAYDDTF